jgi:hypothetical protein
MAEKWGTGAAVAGVAFTAITGAFVLGLYFGSTKVDASEAKCERQLGAKDNELREVHED